MSTPNAGKPEEVVLKLELLCEDCPGITPTFGRTLVEAGAVCLENQGHGLEALMSTDGDCTYPCRLVRTIVVNDQMRRCWNDLDVATEYGAYGVAIMLAKHLTGFTVIERSKKRTGIDWWLGPDDSLFQKKVRLEISGIMKGDSKDISSRVSKKKKQSKQSDATGLQAYICIVEFGTPHSKVVKR